MAEQLLYACDWYELRKHALQIKPYQLKNETMREAALRLWQQAYNDGYEISEIVQFLCFCTAYHSRKGKRQYAAQN